MKRLVVFQRSLLSEVPMHVVNKSSKSSYLLCMHIVELVQKHLRGSVKDDSSATYLSSLCNFFNRGSVWQLRSTL